MTDHGYDPEGETGYRLDQLASAFDRVRDHRDWKAPIRAVIPTEQRPVVEKAVLWFTGTAPEFEPAPGHADRLVVVAPGSRRGPVEGARDEPRARVPRIGAAHAGAGVRSG